MKGITTLLIVSLTAFAFRQSSEVKINFSPESEKYAEATKEYQAIWSSESRRIVEGMEKVSGVKFSEHEIQAVIFEGVSSSGFGDTPMKLRASYPLEVKKGTLIHELGHRLLARIPKTKEIDEHRVLFLVLYDIWDSLYGKEFADRMVEVEKKRRGLYDYESAWQWALALSKEERAIKFKALRESATVTP